MITTLSFVLYSVAQIYVAGWVEGGHVCNHHEQKMYFPIRLTRFALKTTIVEIRERFFRMVPKVEVRIMMIR